MKDVVDMCRKFLKECGMNLAGLTRTTNILWYNPKKPVKFDSEITNFFYSKPCDVFFDEEMFEKHDQDFVLQHIDKYGGAVSLENILATFHWQTFDQKRLSYTTKKGGLSKSLESKKNMYHYIKKKWGNKVRDRKNSIYDVNFNRRRGKK